MLVKQGHWEGIRAETIRYPAHLIWGGWPYTERGNTDIADVAFLSWFGNPQMRVEAVLDEYAAWYCGPCPCAPAVRQWLDLLDDDNQDAQRDSRRSHYRRQTGKADICFLPNSNRQPSDVQVAFLTASRVPEPWGAESAEIRHADVWPQEHGRTGGPRLWIESSRA